MKLIVLVLCLIIMASGYTYVSSPATEYQSIFNLEENGPWIGADVFTSVPAGTDGFLWLLGDTLTGTVSNNQRHITGMPRNSIAMMYPWRNQLPHLEFHIRKDPNNVNSGFFTPKDTKSWFWPISGVYLQNDNKLYLFAYYVYNNGTGSFGFAFHGTALITISNPMSSPDTWQYTYTQIPGTSNDLLWGTASVIEGQYLYLLGFNTAGSILSRISITNLQSSAWTQLEKWSHQTPNAPNPSWNLQPQGSLVTLFEKIPETTIQLHSTLLKYFVLNIEIFTSQIKISWSDQLTGPWSNWEVIYTIPAPWNDTADGVFTYAPKSHPELTTRVNEIILTFASNALKKSNIYMII